jgi:hypothetical protein
MIQAAHLVLNSADATPTERSTATSSNSRSSTPSSWLDSNVAGALPAEGEYDVGV